MTGTKAPDPDEVRLRRGLVLALPGAPLQAVREAGAVRTVAVSGHDFPGVRPDFRVEPGDRVKAGQTLFVDRRRPAIAFAAPAAGIVAAIERGRRRSLDSLVIRLEGGEAESFPTLPASATGEEVRTLLLKSGLWPSFVARPFGRIPDPDAVPHAIFVTAIDTNPLAPDPRVAIGLHEDAFRRGLELLPSLTPGPVFLCHGPGPSLHEKDGRIRPVVFAGPHPAGLAGTHIHRLAPVGGGRSVWQIGYQDVIAIGHLAATGRPLPERIVAVAGPCVREPALARLPLGASLDDTLEGRLAGGPARVVSGSALSGREAGYLGRYHNQVTVLPREGDGPAAGGLLARLRALLSDGPAIVPREKFESVMPLDILPVPLLRALSVGDVETARDLGCLELLEEDMALLSHVCASGADYAALLRDVLDQLAEDGR